MTPDWGGQAALCLLLLILPISALIARRVPILRVLLSLASWAAIGAVALVAINQRERFDPYLQRIAAALKLDDQSVVGRETRIRMSGDGHFWARVRIDGVERRMLVDSGATVTALSAATAAAAGLDIKSGLFPLVINTANGQVEAQTATVRDVRLGDIAARDLGVVVSPAFGDTDVLGMNFLSKLKSWRVEGRTLILVPHHPNVLT
ncbi:MULTISPECIES: TIGR02281 family clan AA aspartic protease [unclassified Sphingomonas]|jgi:aspartyl protease family protein|nr:MULTISPECIES: TIGR02281 family clan AA aspartic protease [unclassified Sphingomonas]AXJ96442.1 TIGR02281 family clan AA aspartic protease [Sphingomonas sp. FARSPH]